MYSDGVRCSSAMGVRVGKQDLQSTQKGSRNEQEKLVQGGTTCLFGVERPLPKHHNCQAPPTPDRRATVHQAMLTPSASMPGSLIATPRGRPEIKEPRSAPVTRAPSVTDMQIFVLPAAAHKSRKSSRNALDVPHAYSGPQSTLRRSGASAFGRDPVSYTHLTLPTILLV